MLAGATAFHHAGLWPARKAQWRGAESHRAEVDSTADHDASAWENGDELFRSAPIGMAARHRTGAPGLFRHEQPSRIATRSGSTVVIAKEIPDAGGAA